MPNFNEAKSPLTSDHVQGWARANFPGPFRALPRPAKLRWMDIDDYRKSRSVFRSLGRSSHKQLLVIGGYAPGPDIEEEPTDQVVAHVHTDEAEVSFYRIAESAEDNEPELQPVNSTATVAFHTPFCDVGEDTGGSKAIHRVSALILFYFLAAGHVKELVRNKSDPTMFTRNFRDACAWVENEGNRPTLPPTKRGFGSMPSPPMPNIAVRPKRSSTVSSLSQPSISEIDPIIHPLKRAATDTLSAKIKRERTDDGTFIPTTDRPKKHPRRTLSEQIIITKFTEPPILSPRSPAPERVNSALQHRIQALKDENGDLRDSITGLEDEKADLRKELRSVKARLTNVEIELASLRERVERAGK